MEIQCGGCDTRYSVSDAKLGGSAFRVRCRRCSDVIVVRRPVADDSGLIDIRALAAAAAATGTFAKRAEPATVALSSLGSRFGPFGSAGSPLSSASSDALYRDRNRNAALTAGLIGAGVLVAGAIMAAAIIMRPLPETRADVTVEAAPTRPDTAVAVAVAVPVEAIDPQPVAAAPAATDPSKRAEAKATGEEPSARMRTTRRARRRVRSTRPRNTATKQATRMPAAPVATPTGPTAPTAAATTPRRSLSELMAGALEHPSRPMPAE